MDEHDMFCEIEYSAPAAGKPAPEPQKIVAPEKDEIRGLFTQMRDIARLRRSKYDYSRFFDRRVQHDEAIIFYEQGMFMKDFEDSYENSAPFSQYFPCYQMMGYEQLRTYFTWRTEVRKGNAANISLSYAFLYIYELLGNIGVDSPQEGLDRLAAFGEAFGVYNNVIGGYLPRWMKDYRIYYDLPEETGTDSFGLFCAISKYDIRKSAFYTDGTSGMIRECFSFVMERIRRDFGAAGMRFDDVFFRPARKIAAWKPFKGAVFHPRLNQPDRRAVLSENEIYICKNNEWTTSSEITSEKGRMFIGYVMKKTEAVLRKLTKYKYKLSANLDMVHEKTIRSLTRSGLFIEKIVPEAVIDFYREATKTVVTVDRAALARIRQEALATQEALIVEERENAAAETASQDIFGEAEPAPVSDAWESLKYALSGDERRALAVILEGGGVKAFALERGIMPEVLADGINEKAADYIGDSLLDEDFDLYDDYKEQARELIE